MALSQQDFEKLKYRLGGSPQGSIAPSAEQAQQDIPQSPGVMSRMGSSLKGMFGSRVGQVAEAKQRSASGQQSIGSGVLQTLGQGAGFINDIVGKGIELAKETPVIKGISTYNKAVFDRFAPQELKDDLSAYAGNLAEKYDRFKADNPEKAANIEAVFNIASLIPIGKAATVAGTEAKNIAVSGAKSAIRTAKEGAQSIDEGVRSAIRSTKAIAEKVSAPEPSILEAAGKVVQGKTKDVSPAIRSIASIDIEGVKTFADLGKKFDSKISELAGKVDADLASDPSKTKLADLVVNAKTASGKPVKISPVDDALKQLEELYTTTGDKVSAENIREIIDIANSEGLNRLEINDIARKYGREFGEKAFGKTGEPLTSVNAQKYENTRKGIKAVARSGIKGAEAQKADELMSSIYETRSLVKKNVEAVNRLKQRIQERGILEKAGNAISKYADILSGGSIRGLIGGLLPRGAGYKVMNALDLEEILSKNLQTIKKAAGSSSDDEIIKLIRSLAPSKKP